MRENEFCGVVGTMVQLLVSVFVETVFETVSINESHLILSFVQCPNHHATKSLNLV